MKPNPLDTAQAHTSDILTQTGCSLSVDDWIFEGLLCVLLFKDGEMDIYPIQEYTDHELTMLQRDSKYKSSWIPIQCGSFIELQKYMYEIARGGLCTIWVEPLEIK